MKKSLNIFSITLILVFSLATITLAQNFPLQYQDALGRNIKIENKVQRIVSLAPAITEIIYALGAESRLVAVSSACDYPKQALAKEKIGRIEEPDIEKIVALEPDLVLTESVTKIETLNRLSELGIKNIGFKPSSINDTIDMIEDISYLISAQTQGKKLTKEMRKEYKNLSKLVEEKLEKKQRPRVFYQIWLDPLYTAGEGTFIDDLITKAGGYNVASKAAGRWPTYSAESLIAADPEVYISSQHSTPEGLDLEDLSQKKIFREVSAFKNKRVYLVDQDLVNRPSNRIIKGYKEIIKAIFPDLKEEIN